jgi:NAD(P)-dependent dehydrogenase (short-subunit alcohol dehydrogenase family)
VLTGLLGKVVVVTGAARGTGRTHCERFADEGADVIALDIPAADELGDTAGEVESRGRRCATGLAEVSDLDTVTAAIDHGVAELGLSWDVWTSSSPMPESTPQAPPHGNLTPRSGSARSTST